MKVRRIQTRAKSRRELTSQEHLLWAEVTQQVVRSKSAMTHPYQPSLFHENLGRSSEPPLSIPEPIAKQQPNAKNLGAAIDRKMRRQLRRGARKFDQTLDLHGMNQREAYERLKAFLIRAQANEVQLVLIITGRGDSVHPYLPETGRGVLRRQVPEWLRSFSTLVSGFEEASARHGGGGALFVSLRRSIAR